MSEELTNGFVNHCIKDTGMLLCNENPFFPSLCGIGGDWNTIMTLIEDREVFHSKVFKARTTYLSKEMYFYLKRFKQRKTLGETEKRIFDFLEETGGADTAMIKNSLLIGSKEFKKSMDKLLSDLQVTVLRRGKSLSESWTALVWGTYLQWERDCTVSQYSLADEECRTRIHEILSTNLSSKDIEQIFR